MHWSYRANAASFFLVTLCGIGLAVSFADTSTAWMTALLLECVLFGAIGVLLWRRVPWAVPLGLGLTGYCAVGFAQAAGAAAMVAATDPWGLSFQAYAGLSVGCTAAFGLLWTTPRTMSARQGFAVAFAGAALVTAVTFALAPGQAAVLSGVMLGGAAVLVCGAVGLARGRTWGLLVNVLGAACMGIGAWLAPSVASLPATHPLVVEGSSLLVSGMGVIAASLAAISSGLYLGPIVRFLLRAPSAESEA
ncbi:MAG: hypothetical protein AAGA54_36330 [Myxococcota bacterium]